ncbi:MAG: hypothetical protein ACR2KG_06795 [Nocardioidaceae bacterium]
MKLRRTAAALVALLAAVAMGGGCGAAKEVKPAGDGVPKSWYAALEKNYTAAAAQAPVTSVPEFSTDSRVTSPRRWRSRARARASSSVPA